MSNDNRRDFLRHVAGAAAAGTTLALFPPAIRKALAIPANRRTGTIRDVEHVVILTQENRSFDHYFGTFPGVRGFGDRFPIPVEDSAGIRNKTVWYQAAAENGGAARVVVPFHLNTQETFDYMRVTGTPHLWPDAQLAWAEGKLNEWPRHKREHSLGYFSRADLPFQFAMAEAFTLCDAYHCSFHGGTNPNRVFLWSGSNDPLAQGNGPVLTNTYDNLEHDPDGGYGWLTYCERLQQAGIRWQIYQDMADNFTDNPAAGFRSYRAAYRGEPGSLAALEERGLSTRDLDRLRDDVIDGKLPQVSWIVATAEGSEHPGPSSPAQGADYTGRVLDALTADPEVWARTVLLVNFDENDGFFDHVPPPAVPSYVRWDADASRAELAGASTVDTMGEYHERLAPGVAQPPQLPLHRPYGLGPRVPMYVISPWSKGGWVNSQVFDHTSVIRFLERRFGVQEANISAWRRAVCGDLTSAFDFSRHDDQDFYDELPGTGQLAARARSLPGTRTPPTPAISSLPAQERGVRRSRALPYELNVQATLALSRIQLAFQNTGRAAAVFHVYDRRNLERVPRRYTVEPRRQLTGVWELGGARDAASEQAGGYDLWLLGPNGFHRHFTGQVASTARAPGPEVEVRYDALLGSLSVRLFNPGDSPCRFVLTANAYYQGGSWNVHVAPRASAEHFWPLRRSGYWYDFTARVQGLPMFSRRFAGRLETGRDSHSDPAMGGEALGEQLLLD